MLRVFVLSTIVSALATAALADQTIRLNVSAKVGQTQRIEVVADWRSDCSPRPTSIEIVAPPSLGQLTQQVGAVSHVKHSLAGNCIGASIPGVGVDYTATQPGADRFKFDQVLESGRVHYTIIARNH